MRICYIANSASSHTAKWAKYFSSLGHDVYIVSHRNVEVPGTHLYYLDYNLRNFTFMAGKVHDVVRKINPDILHAQQANTCGLYAASMKDYNVIVSAWGSDILIGPQESIILKKIVQYVIKKAYFITSDSEYMTEKIVELGSSRDKVYTFPMGVEEELLNYRHDFNNDDGTLRIISTRKLEELYKIDVIINGFKKALAKDASLYLTVAADGEERPKLEKMVRDYGIEDKVTFTGSYRPQDVGKLLQPNIVFVSIPESDSTSVSLLEGMCCGLFPLVSDLPANREWVTDKDNGIVLKAIDGDSVRDSILWCSKNRDKLKAASLKNTEMIRKKAIWINNAKIVENLYDSILSINQKNQR